MLFVKTNIQLKAPEGALSQTYRWDSPLKTQRTTHTHSQVLYHAENKNQDLGVPLFKRVDDINLNS